MATKNSEPDFGFAGRVPLTDETRIAIVGPIPPTRGGVARHTGSLARAVSKRTGVQARTWSFYRQYPAFLYPGSNERDLSSSAMALDTNETLSGTNPISWQKTSRQIQAWGPDKLVIPAWTFFLAPALGWIARQHPQADRCMIVHNAFDHESAGWKNKLSQFQLAQADRFLTHNQALKQVLETHFPGKPVQVFPHPVFDDFPKAKGTLHRRAAVELLFFGLVRPYKGLDILLDALSRVDREDFFLTIAGEFWGNDSAAKAQVRKLGLTDRVELIPRFVSDEEAAELFHRADAVVLPYRSVTGSGVVANAYHYGCPVVASNLPGLSEVIEDGQTGWLFESENPNDLARVIASLNSEHFARAGLRAAQLGRTLSWDHLADLVISEDAT